MARGVGGGGVPNTLEQGTKSEVAHNPRRLRGPQRFRAVDKIMRGQRVGLVNPALWGITELRAMKTVVRLGWS